MHATARRLTVALAAILVASLGAAAVQANHLQTDSGKAIVFDHKTGNEYWVEVVVSGSGASSVTKVEVTQPRQQPWMPLEKKSWGAWGGSHHFTPGEPVRFRATFTDGVQAVSCWFTHPAGTEQCGVPTPTGDWKVQSVGNAGTVGVHGSVTADLDGDGRSEVYVLGGDGLIQHRKEAAGWHAAKILGPTPSLGWTEALALTAGDADDDGRIDIYSAVRTVENLHQSTRIFASSWDGTAWVHEEAAHVAAFVDAMAVGDVDGDGLDEIWVAEGLAVGRLDRTPSFWTMDHAASFPEAVFGIAVGDADRDGDDEAWAASGLDDHADLWRIEADAGGYSLLQVAHSTAHGARDVVVGDGDNDGQVEAYVMDSAYGEEIQVLRFSNGAAGWTERRIDLGPGRPLGLDLADGDGDGKRELYVSDWDGRLLRASWTGSAWAGAAVAQLGSGDFLQEITIGDTEGDGKPEAYGFGVDPAASPGPCCNPVTMFRIAKEAPPPPGSFDAIFTGFRGNEWWVQANVATTGGTLAKVDVRLNSGAWQPLAKQSWGGWTASYHIVQGTIVQMRATATDGQVDLSSCRQWIPPSNQDATIVDCSGAPPPGFDATFTGVKGNEWWVQANVAGNQGIAKVEARVNCGATWQTLPLQSWGGYAKSFHVPNGSKVDFRATSSTGATDLSSGYVWPQATPTAAC